MQNKNESFDGQLLVRLESIVLVDQPCFCFGSVGLQFLHPIDENPTSRHPTLLGLGSPPSSPHQPYNY